MKTKIIKIGLVDDHSLLRRGLADLLINSGFEILFEASNGKEFIEIISKGKNPDVVLMDINMPVMDGFEATKWAKDNYPGLKIIALSMYDDVKSVLKILKYGAVSYLTKYAAPNEIIQAINKVFTDGFYASDIAYTALLDSLNHTDSVSIVEDNKVVMESKITQRELEFLKLCATDLPYKEIAERMNISPRTVDGYRDNLFAKSETSTRIGLVIYAMKNKLITL